MHRLFEELKLELNRFFDLVDSKGADKVLQRLLECKGAVIFSGVGKSGLIAQKISATFLSTGTRAFYLSAADALHGDIGMVTREDVLIVLSKSGESQELIDLIPHVKRKGAFVIAVVSKRPSRLEAMADQAMFLPVEKELCPYNLVPTTSCAAQLLFGDALAIGLMQSKEFTIGDFAANHPAGLLGRKITAKVADLMLKGKEIPMCRPNAKLIDVLHELSSKRCGCLLIADENEALQGIFTDGDLRRAIQEKGSEALHMTVALLMNRFPKTVSPES